MSDEEVRVLYVAITRAKLNLKVPAELANIIRKKTYPQLLWINLNTIQQRTRFFAFFIGLANF